MTCRLVFDATEYKTEYLQDYFTGNTIPEHNHPKIEMEFAGEIILENGFWICFFRCIKCPQKYTMYGKFSGEEFEREKRYQLEEMKK